MSDLCGKYALASLMNLYDGLFPGFAALMPRTWLLPDQAEEALALMPLKPSPGTPSLIVKPESGSQGDGIFLCRTRADLAQHVQPRGVAQQYIANPLLLDGFKFDFRLYVLLTSIEPVRAYVCRSPPPLSGALSLVSLPRPCHGADAHELPRRSRG